jgi:hypothetical protein
MRTFLLEIFFGFETLERKRGGVCLLRERQGEVKMCLFFSLFFLFNYQTHVERDITRERERERERARRRNSRIGAKVFKGINK